MLTSKEKKFYKKWIVFKNDEEMMGFLYQNLIDYDKDLGRFPSFIPKATLLKWEELIKDLIMVEELLKSNNKVNSCCQHLYTVNRNLTTILQLIKENDIDFWKKFEKSI